MNEFPKKINTLNTKNTPFIKIPKIKNLFQEQKKINEIKEKSWNSRFVYNKIPYYDSYKDKNVLCYKKFSNYLSYRKIENYLNQKSSKNDSININNYSRKKFYFNRNDNPLVYSYENKQKSFSANYGGNYIKDNSHLYCTISNYSNRDYSNPNLINLYKLWDELEISNPYRKYFNFIYKELETEYKDEIYQKEIQELNKVKSDIKNLKYYIGLRLKIIEEIKNLNEKLGQELINNNNSKEILLNDISNKIISLRDQTINVCQSMKKFKKHIFSINNLDKYDFELIFLKYKIDKNYIIKMKSELNFLREGFAKYYFNLEDDQNPFLLKASNKSKITNKDNFIRLIPLNDESKRKIIDCIYYIYQELIAYQSYNLNKKDLRRISPIKLKDSDFNYDKKVNTNINKKLLKNNIKCLSPMNRECITDRLMNKLINGIENIKISKGTGNHFDDSENKKFKENYEKNNENNIKLNGYNTFYNPHNNLINKNNKTIKSLIKKDKYDNKYIIKENYDKDQINNNLILKYQNQSSIIKEKNNEKDNINESNSLNKSPLYSNDEKSFKINYNIIENQIINKS